MKALEKEVIINEAAKVKPGTITRLLYKTECPIKSAYKKKGYRMVKLVETSARLGVNYHKIASVIARKAEMKAAEVIQRTNNYEWILRNKVRHNTATGKDYLYAASFNRGHHTNNFYILMKPEGDIEYLSSIEVEQVSQYRDLLVPSYFNRQGPAEIRNISFENIYRIGSEGPTMETLSDADMVSLFN